MIKGIIPVVPTPFSDDGSTILYDRFRAIVELVIQEGADAIMLFGAGGEFYKLNGEERRRLLVEALQICKDRIPVAATVTAHATIHAIEEADSFQRMGVGLINIMPPSFGAPTGIMIRDHILDLAKTIEIPIMLQYAPALTGSVIYNEVFSQIADAAGNDLYIKIEAVPTGPAISKLVTETKGKYHVIIGNAGECLYEALERGAIGVMGGCAFVKPYRDIIDAFGRGDRQKAYELFNLFLPYLHFIHRHIEEFVSMEKMILCWRGILKDMVCRSPNMYPDSYSVDLLRKNYLHTLNHFYNQPY
jgi:4-hydroxy-tetrahydrodipicolinate synthase